MSNRINNKALLTVNSVRTQMALQLAEKGDVDLDIGEMQLNMKDTLDKAMKIANSSPDGLITIAFSKKPWGIKLSPQEMMQAMEVGISFFNTNNFGQHLTRTVIVVDKFWSGKFRVLRCSYGLSDDYLKEE